MAEAKNVRLTEQQSQANLLAVLQLCATGALRCSEKTGRPGAATVGTVAGVLDGGDFYPDEPIAAFAWPMLIQAGGLVELTGGRLQLTARGRAALAKPPADTIRSLWRSWVTRGGIDELSRVEHIKGQRAANVLTSVKTRRRTVATALATCPPGEWIELDELFSRMQLEDLSPKVARSERGLWKLYLSDAQYGSLGYAGFGEWPLLEGRYTLAVLFEYAATLGLIDVDYTDPADARNDFRENWGTDDLDYLSRYDGLWAIRVNALGRFALDNTDGYQPPAAEPAGKTLKVLSNHDIVAVGQLSAADRITLDAYAAPVSDRVWTLRADTLLAAIDAGQPLDQLTRFLTNRIAHDLPITVTTLIADAASRSRQLRDCGVVRLIECADPAVAVLVSRDRKLGRLGQLIGDRHLAVPIAQETEFRKALRSLGYVLPQS